MIQSPMAPLLEFLHKQKLMYAVYEYAYGDPHPKKIECKR